ncbi:MAG TPA: hypothetical protein VFU15_00450, partial [Bacteroidia bacterium]|nr:hypothetical protein [Bacteroidia bacterium]
MRTPFYIALILLLASFAAGKTEKKYDPAKLFTVKQLQEDFTALRARLERKDPNLYLYTPKKRLDFVFDSLYSRIEAPMTAMDFFRLLAALRSEIRDGHTYPMASREMENGFFNKDSVFLPYLFVYLRHKLYVRRSFTPDSAI